MRAAAVAVLLVAACRGEGVEPRHPCQGELIVYSGFVGQENTPHLFHVRPDGSGQDLLSTSARGYSPVWSPNGCLIAFATPQGQNSSDVAVMREDGSGLRRITSDTAFDGDPAWSPDGTRIAFRSQRGGRGDIWVMNADGSSPVNLTQDDKYDWQPAWSPDGTRIAFCVVIDDFLSSGPDALDVIRVDGTGRVRLVPDGVVGCADWSPDGSRIVFTTLDEASFTWAIEVINADGSGRTTLRSSEGGLGQPAWSPDGRKIVFAADLRPRPEPPFSTDGLTQLYVIDADGSNLRQITNGARSSFAPDWRR